MRAARKEIFRSQTQMSYLVTTNDLKIPSQTQMSYLVATNANVLETKDKDKCLNVSEQTRQGQPLVLQTWGAVHFWFYPGNFEKFSKLT